MKSPHDIINESGYPLQLFLEDEINSSTSKHGWQVLVKEHRWIDSEKQEDGYIDLVLEHLSYITRLIVECKRVNGSWTFLLPNTSRISLIRSKVLRVKYPTPIIYNWEDCSLRPESYESTFCVMEVEGKKDNRSLEKYSSNLLLSLENLAVEEIGLLSKSLEYQHNKAYLPIIITTANLQVCFVDRKEDSLEDGNINPSSEVNKIDFIRFRKNLAGNLESSNPEINNLKKANLENERTIIIVQAKNIVDYLCHLQFQ